MALALSGLGLEFVALALNALALAVCLSQVGVLLNVSKHKIIQTTPHDSPGTL